MAKSDNFWGGFLLGATVGAVVGAIVAVKVRENGEEGERLEGKDSGDVALSLEEKIAQLNAAIDAVSEELAISNNKRPV